MEEKRKIASDVDEVLLSFIPALRDYYNRKFSTNLVKEDYYCYDLEKVWGCTKQRAIEIVTGFYMTEEFKKIPPLEGAQEATMILSEKNNIEAVTSRPTFIEIETKESLKRHFGRTISSIFVNGQYGNGSSSLDKSDYCLKNKIYTILEDNLDIAKKCADRGMRVFLFDNLWNRNGNLPKNIIRVGEKRNPWDEVVEHLN